MKADISRQAQMEKAEEQRQKAYDRYQEQWSQIRIAKELGISQARVSQYLSEIEKRDWEWYDKYADPKERRRTLYNRINRYYERLLREKWVLFHQADKPGVRDNVLNGMSRILEGYARQLGAVAPNLDMAWLMDKQREINEALAKMEKGELQGPEVAYPKWATKGLGEK